MDRGFHLTWSKAAAIVTVLGALQGVGYFVGRPGTADAAGVKTAVLETKVDGLTQKVDELSRHFDAIEACLRDKRCGR